MEKINKIFYINLDERIDRNTHTLDQFNIHNIPKDKIERFSAINGKTHNFIKDELNMFKKSDFNTKFINPYIVTKKLMGNQLSHFNILLEMKKRNYNNIIIFQDDVILKNDFIKYIDEIMKDIPENAEIVNIGMLKKASYDISEPYDLSKDIIDNSIIENKVTNFVYQYRVWNSESGHRINPASLAYIVTKKGCNNLIEYFYKNGFNYATDWNYNLYLQSKNIFYGSKYVLCTGNNKFISDVFVDTSKYPLEELINLDIYYTDKNTTHSYFELYNNLFSSIRDKAKNILEIGIGDFNQKNGGSIILWRLYFKNAIIHAADILSEERVYDIVLHDKNIKTHLKTNAYDKAFICGFKNNNLLFDLILDDGPHTFESQCECINLYSELLSENGILVIEDVQNMSWIDKFIELTPSHLKKYIHVYDLRHIKNRYDDIVFVINKNVSNEDKI